MYIYQIRSSPDQLYTFSLTVKGLKDSISPAHSLAISEEQELAEMNEQRDKIKTRKSNLREGIKHSIFGLSQGQ